jgi:hypothetical protein
MEERNDEPNIFLYATSELSQDAFFCWLLEHLNMNENNSKKRLEIKNVAIDLVNKIICNYKEKIKDEYYNREYEKPSCFIDYPLALENYDVKIYKQNKYMDIIVEFAPKCDKENGFLFLIEDKTESEEGQESSRNKKKSPYFYLKEINQDLFEYLKKLQPEDSDKVMNLIKSKLSDILLSKEWNKIEEKFCKQINAIFSNKEIYGELKAMAKNKYKIQGNSISDIDINEDNDVKPEHFRSLLENCYPEYFKKNDKNSQIERYIKELRIESMDLKDTEDTVNIQSIKKKNYFLVPVLLKTGFIDRFKVANYYKNGIVCIDCNDINDTFNRQDINVDSEILTSWKYIFNKKYYQPIIKSIKCSNQEELSIFKFNELLNSNDYNKGVLFESLSSKIVNKLKIDTIYPRINIASKPARTIYELILEQDGWKYKDYIIGIYFTYDLVNGSEKIKLAIKAIYTQGKNISHTNEELIDLVKEIEIYTRNNKSDIDYTSQSILKYTKMNRLEENNDESKQLANYKIDTNYEENKKLAVFVSELTPKIELFINSITKALENLKK